MVKVIQAFREAPMDDRRQKRVDDLIARYHKFFKNCFGAIMNPGYDEYEDGSETSITIVVSDDDATTAASEFRSCGFIVGHPSDDQAKLDDLFHVLVDQPRIIETIMSSRKNLNLKRA